MPGRGIRVALFLPVFGWGAYNVAHGNAFAVVWLVSVVLITPEIVAFFGWIWNRGREHVYDESDYDVLYTFDMVDIHMRMEGEIPWFLARDIGWVFDIKDIRPTIERYGVGERGEIGEDGALCLSEKGVLRLASSLRHPRAPKFRLWFERDVMFPIRRKRGDPPPTA